MISFDGVKVGDRVRLTAERGEDVTIIIRAVAVTRSWVTGATPGAVYLARDWDTLEALDAEHARAEVAEAKLAALEAQPDWEYGEQSKYSDAVWLVDRDNTAIWDDIPSDRRVRRREAGPWEPVPDTRSDT